MVQGDEGARLENLVACALFKEIHRAQDVDGENVDLYFIKNKDGQEIDFWSPGRNSRINWLKSNGKTLP